MGDYRIDEEDLIRDILGLARWLGHDPSMPEYDKYGRYGSTTIGSRLGGWNRAKEMAGVTGDGGFSRGDGFYKQISNSDLSQEISRLKNSHGKISAPVMQEHGEYSVSTFNYRFGSWNEGLRELGFGVAEKHSHEAEDLIDMLRVLGMKLGRRPTYHDVNDETGYSASTLYTHFETFDDALAAAGYEPGRRSVPCDNCGVSLSRKRSRILENGHFFCDEDCQGEWLSKHKSGKDSWNWKGGGPWDYGPNWDEQREKALDRDDYTCQSCGKQKSEHWRDLSLHHIKRIKWFKENYDAPEWWQRGNDLANLVTYCDGCHQRWEGIPIRPTHLRAM